MSASLDIGLLGPLVVRRGGKDVPIAAPKQRALLALLALQIGRAISTDELVDKLWSGRPPESAPTALQVYVSQLRKLLGSDVIATRRPGYALDLRPDAVDAVRFEHLVGDGRSLHGSGDPESAAAVLGEALASWRGAALVEFVYENWAAAPARRLDELRLVAIEDLLDAQLQVGQGSELTGELEGLVREHPLRERLRGQHMLALYRAGRQSDALSAYQDARSALVDGLGIDPSPALVELERRILQQDPSLTPTTREGTGVQPSADAPVSLAAQPTSAGQSAELARPLLCQQCGAEIAGTAKFCSECGSSLAAERTGPERQQRKLVTVLFCDVVGSTALGELLDPEVVRGVMRRYFDAASAVISRHGGSVEKFIGDAVVALFGVPTIHEDDALRAVRAADEIRTAVGVLADETESRWGVRVETRIGVNTGEVVVGADPSTGSLATGETVNLAARLEQAAEAKEILIGEATWQLVRDAVVAEPVDELLVKGKADRVRPHRLVEVRAGAEGHRRRMDLPLVGREAERKLLRDSYDRWVGERACGLVTVLGTAGVGKSRLVAEVMAELEDEAQIVQGRCLPYGSGITYWPLSEAIRQLAGVEDDHTSDQVRQRLHARLAGAADADLIVAGVLALMGVADADAGAEDARWAVRRLIEHVALPRPLILVVDDLQWAEAPLLQLVDEVVDTVNDAPVLVLCVARPELLDGRADWGGGKLNATTILLEPLGPAQTDELVRHLLGGRTAPDELRVRVTAAAAGNPLFAEELLAYLQERGHINLTGDTVALSDSLDQLELPPTIRALISARLDQLPDEERSVLERGAVEGEVFHSGAIAALSSTGAGRAELRRLVRKQVLKPDQPQLPGQDAFRFRHLLIRDATYEGIPKNRRAEWHRGFAEWLDRTVGERRSEYEEILAYHYAAAFRYGHELGLSEYAALRDQAALLLRLSADRAMAAGDVANAALLLHQLAAILPEGHPVRVVALCDAAFETRSSLDWEEFRRLVEQAAAEGTGSHREAELYALATKIYLDLGELAPERGSLVETAERAAALAGEAAEHGWHRAAAIAWEVVGEAALVQMHAGDMRVAGEAMLEHSRLAGDSWLERDAITTILDSATWGDGPLADALDQVGRLLPEDDTRLVSAKLRAQERGVIEMRAGNVAAGIELLTKAREIAEDLGHRIWEADWCLGLAHLDACLPDQALPYFVRMTAELAEAGDVAHASTTAALAAHALADLERYDEAAEYVEKARHWAAADDISSQVALRGANARTRAAAGEHGAAERLARESAELAAETDCAELRGRALIDRAWVSLEIGKPEVARESADAAVQLLTRRGALPMLRQAEQLLEQANRMAAKPRQRKAGL